MRTAIELFLKALREEEFYCEEAEEWQFGDGSACAICTASARRVALQFGGLIFGYQSAGNPTASIGLPSIGGHDFALIGDRWLVDYWAWRVVGILTEPIQDLSTGEGRAAARMLYGLMSAWHPVEFTPTP